MKANELMIGDWVLDGDEVARVTSLTCDGIIETTRCISNIEVVTPIPITAEILEKNGFKIDYWCKLKGEEFWLSQSGDEYRAYTSGDCDKRDNFCWLQFVHELQHALRLCGIDKELTI